MKRILGIGGLLACLAFAGAAPVAVGQDAQGDLLSAVPGDAWAALCVRNAGELDQKLMTLAQQLNVPPMSALQLVKMQLGLMSGVNDAGGAAVVVMPVDNFGMINEGMAVLVPCQDYAGLTGMMQLEPAGEGFDGISRGMIAGQPAFLAQQGAYAIVAPVPGAVQKFLASKEKPAIGKTWTKHQLDRFAKDDVTLWINVDGLVSSPAFQTGVMPMMAMMSGGAFNPQDLQEIRSWVIGLRMDAEGIYLGLAQTIKEGTAAASLLAATKPTTESLLAGLPADDYLVAMGVRGSKEGWAKAAEGFNQMLSNPMIAMQLQADPEKLEHIKKIIGSLITATRDFSFSAAALPAGPDGMLGFAKVVSVEGDASGLCTQIGDLIGTIVSMAPAEEAAKVQNLVKFTPDAEQIAGASVSHLAINLDQADDVDKAWLDKLTKVVGKEGLLFRIAAIGDNHIVSTFGGGPARMQRVIELLKAGEAPLGANEGLKKAASLLPASRVLEGYVAVDHLMNTIGDISKVVDSPDAPPAFPKIDAPVAVVAGPAGGDTFQVDIAAPMPVVIAIKDTIMAAQGGGAPPADGGEEPKGTAADGE